MNLIFTIGNDIKYEKRLNYTLQELLPNFKNQNLNTSKNTFKIPLNVY